MNAVVIMTRPQANKQVPFVARWRNAFMGEHGPKSATRRLVLHTLAAHMDANGKDCFPGTNLIAKEAAISQRSACTHLDTAEREGWLRRTKKGSGQGWKRHEYIPTIPKGAEPSSVRSPKGAEPRAKGAEPRDINVLNDVQSSSPCSSPLSSPSLVGNRYQYSSDFEDAWKNYPKRTGGNDKRAAYKAWCARTNEGYSPEQMAAGIERYRRYCDAEGKAGTKFVKLAATFLGPADPPHFLEDWKPERGKSNERFEDKVYTASF